MCMHSCAYHRGGGGRLQYDSRFLPSVAPQPHPPVPIPQPLQRAPPNNPGAFTPSLAWHRGRPALIAFCSVIPYTGIKQARIRHEIETPEEKEHYRTDKEIVTPTPCMHLCTKTHTHVLLFRSVRVFLYRLFVETLHKGGVVNTVKQNKATG